MIWQLALRQLKLFFRDKSGVFFALLSPLILLVLYVLFLGTVQVENLEDKMPGVSSEAIGHFITSWVCAGIVLVATLTASLSALNTYIEDKISGRFRDFAVLPLSKLQRISGYVIGSVLISVTISLIVLVVCYVYMIITGTPLPDLMGTLQIIGYILLLCAAFSALAMFVVTLIKSLSAYTSLSVIVGTLSGFLAGMYIQIGTLSTAVANIISALPFAQGLALLNDVFTQKTIAALGVDSGAAGYLRDHYSIGSVQVGSVEIGVTGLLIVFALIIIVFMFLGAWRIGKKIS